LDGCRTNGIDSTVGYTTLRASLVDEVVMRLRC
jgi:hypothetical protein